MLAVYRLLVLSLGVALAYLAVMSALWSLGRTQGGFGIPEVLPDDPAIALSQAVAEFRGNPGGMSDLQQPAVLEAAKLDPLAAEPLLFAALLRLRAGDDEKAIAFLEEARRRNPRAVEARIMLLDAYLKTGNAYAATWEIAGLSQFLPKGQDALVTMLAGLAVAPATRSATLAALPSNPLRIAVLQRLARDSANASLVMDIVQAMPRAARDSREAERLESIIQAFINRGDIEGGYSLWSQVNANLAPAGRAGLVDGTFSGRARPPFGWSLSPTASGYAEIDGGALKIEYYGREGGVFARQLLALPPGSYQLQYSARHGQKQPANLVWRINCLVSGATLLDLPLNSPPQFGQLATDHFIVPAGDCPAQWLSLGGARMEQPETRSTEFRKLSIHPAGAR